MKTKEASNGAEEEGLHVVEPFVEFAIRMSHWRRQTTEGAEFWITCKQLAFLISFSRLYKWFKISASGDQQRHMWQLDTMNGSSDQM